MSLILFVFLFLYNILMHFKNNFNHLTNKSNCPYFHLRAWYIYGAERVTVINKQFLVLRNILNSTPFPSQDLQWPGTQKHICSLSKQIQNEVTKGHFLYTRLPNFPLNWSYLIGLLLISRFPLSQTDIWQRGSADLKRFRLWQVSQSSSTLYVRWPLLVNQMVILLVNQMIQSTGQSTGQLNDMSRDWSIRQYQNFHTTYYNFHTA